MWSSAKVVLCVVFTKSQLEHGLQSRSICGWSSKNFFFVCVVVSKGFRTLNKRRFSGIVHYPIDSCEGLAAIISYQLQLHCFVFISLQFY